MKSNNIRDILIEYGEAVDSQGYEVPELGEAVSQLEAIVDEAIKNERMKKLAAEIREGELLNELKAFIENWIRLEKKDPHYVMEAKLGARIEFVELAKKLIRQEQLQLLGRLEKQKLWMDVADDKKRNKTKWRMEAVPVDSIIQIRKEVENA